MHESSQKARIRYAVKKGNQQMMKPPTMMPTVFAAFVSAWKRRAWNLPVFVRRVFRTEAAELRALPARDEHGLRTPRFECTLGLGDSLFLFSAV